MSQDPVTDDRPATAVPAAASRVGPLHVVAAIAGALAIWSAGGPVNDFDSYWHVELGREIVRTHGVHDLPTWWLGVPEPSGWVTSQWLSEVLMHLLVAGGGWKAVIAARILVMTGFVIGLALVLLRGHRPSAGVPIFILTLAASAGGILDRPQTAGLLLLIWLGHVGVRLWTTGHRPPLWVIAGVSLVWAQLHGSWVLLPAVFGLIAIGLQMDAGRTRAPGLRAVLLGLVASLAGVINPHGLTSFLLPFRFDAATGGAITEWWPTTFASGFSAAWGLVLLAVILGWARRSSPIPWVELVWVIGWTVFGLQSYRNVGPAALLTAPAAVFRLEHLLEAPSGSDSGSSSRREGRVLSLGCALIVLVGIVVTLVHLRSVDPFARTPGHRIAAWVAAQPGPVRIFNNRNAAGGLIGLSDHKARLIVDGRADLWGAAYANRIRDAQQSQPGTLRTVTDFRPDAVVTERTNGLVTTLTGDGWRVALSDGQMVLLLPDKP